MAERMADSRSPASRLKSIRRAPSGTARRRIVTTGGEELVGQIVGELGRPAENEGEIVGYHRTRLPKTVFQIRRGNARHW